MGARTRWARPAVLVVLAVAAVAVALLVGIPPIEELRAWVAAAGWAGPVLYAGVFAGLSLTPAPATLLSVGAGVLFGWAVGVPVVAAGAMTGAVIGFALSRSLGRGAVRGRGGDRMARLDAMLERRGMTAVMAIRLVPVVPFAVLNAACGLSALRTRDYVIGTAVGMLPAIAAFVGIGAFGGDPGSAPFLVAVGGVVVLLLATVVLARRRPRGTGIGIPR